MSEGEAVGRSCRLKLTTYVARAEVDVVVADLKVDAECIHQRHKVAAFGTSEPGRGVLTCQSRRARLSTQGGSRTHRSLTALSLCKSFIASRKRPPVSAHTPHHGPPVKAPVSGVAGSRPLPAWHRRTVVNHLEILGLGRAGVGLATVEIHALATVQVAQLGYAGKGRGPQCERVVARRDDTTEADAYTSTPRPRPGSSAPRASPARESRQSWRS